MLIGFDASFLVAVVQNSFLYFRLQTAAQQNNVKDLKKKLHKDCVRRPTILWQFCDFHQMYRMTAH